MIITGAMLAYQSTPQQVIFWQLANQSVNAVVNYTNRSGDADISTAELSANFLGATTLASGTALGIKKVALQIFKSVFWFEFMNTPYFTVTLYEDTLAFKETN